MNSSELVAAVRRGIRELKPETVTDATITTTLGRAVTVLGLKLKEIDPFFFSKRVSVSSYTHIFEKPSDCMTVSKVWDLETVAGTVTDATNTTPIVITEAAHGRSDDDIITIHDVIGNTAANGTFQITVVGASSYSLNGSAGTAAYTSGGKVFEVPQSPDEIRKIAPNTATGDRSNSWYPRANLIVVDDIAFENDILLDYLYRPTKTTDIPAEYHEGLVGFAVVTLIKIPAPDSRHYADFKGSYVHHSGMWQMVLEQVNATAEQSSEPSYIKDVWNN